MKMELILCEKVDKDLKTYTNVFDEVKECNSLDFTLVCKIEFEETCDKEMRFHFFIFRENGNEKMGLYLKEGVYIRDKDECENRDVFSDEFQQTPIFGVGNYAIEVVRNDRMKDASDGLEVYKTGEKIGRTTFAVK